MQKLFYWAATSNGVHDYSGLVLCVGGPAFVEYIRPTDEELFQVRCAPPHRGNGYADPMHPSDRIS